MILFLKLANFRRERQSQLTIATATVFFHRFYVVPANRDIDKYVVATACLFLAGKVEETPTRGEKSSWTLVLSPHRSTTNSRRSDSYHAAKRLQPHWLGESDLLIVTAA